MELADRTAQLADEGIVAEAVVDVHVSNVELKTLDELRAAIQQARGGAFFGLEVNGKRLGCNAAGEFGVLAAGEPPQFGSIVDTGGVHADTGRRNFKMKFGNCEEMIVNVQELAGYAAQQLRLRRRIEGREHMLRVTGDGRMDWTVTILGESQDYQARFWY